MGKLPAGPHFAEVVSYTADRTVLCRVQIEWSWLMLHFPKVPFERLAMSAGDKFWWVPSEDGSFTEENITDRCYDKLLI